MSLFGAEVSDAFTVNLAVDSSKDTVGLGLGNTLGLLLWCGAVVETHTNNSFESVTEATEVGEGGGKALVIDAIIVLLLVFADGENALRLLFAIVSLFSGRTSGNVDDRHNQLRFFNDDRFDDLRFFNDDRVDDLRHFFKANLRHAIFEDFIRVNTDVVRGLSSAICLVLQSSTGNNDGDYLLRVHNDGLVDDLRRIIVARR